MKDALENAQQLDGVFSVAYEELRRLASAVSRNDPGVTLNPTALVNEAWLKLAGSRSVATTSPLHFKRIAARAMRQVLVEAARRRHSGKRGAGRTVLVTLNELPGKSSSCAEDLLTLDGALRELGRIEPRQATLIESRFFGGLEIAEIATLLQVSEATVHREWRAAKAWLKGRLRVSAEQG